MNKAFLLIWLILPSFITLAQEGREIKGIVKDTLGNSVIRANVKLSSNKDTLTSRTDIDGNFTIKHVSSSIFYISVTSINYKPFHKRYLFNDSLKVLILPPIILENVATQLTEVVISGTPPITIKQDTVEYRAKDYKLREEATTEDLLKKLPGLEVDKNGNVVAHGQNITKVRINGKDYFGGDVKAATQNLPADIIDKIQVIDDYGDQANITGIKNGDPDKVLAIQLRSDKNKGLLAKSMLGSGTENRYQISLSTNYLSDKQQISLLGSLNNTNLFLFNFNNNSLSGGRQGGNDSSVQEGRGTNGSSNVSNANGLATNSNNTSSLGDGITNLSSIGFNYRADWSKKISSYGSYSYANRNNDILAGSVQQNYYENIIIQNIQNSTSNIVSNNHRINWNLEYKIDSLNYLKVSPNITYGNNKTKTTANSSLQSNGVLTSAMVRSEDIKTSTPNFGGNVLFNHRFYKSGRNISLNIGLNNSHITQNQDVNTQSISPSSQRQAQDINNNNTNYNLSLSYSEPLTLKASLEFNYTYNLNSYNNNRLTNDIDFTGLITPNNAQSNHLDYTFTTNRIGVNFRVKEKKYNYFIGATVQPSVLASTLEVLNLSTFYRHTGLHFIPSARFSYNFSKTRSFSVGLFGKSNEPTYAQLQSGLDQSNPQFPVRGNPNLNAEFNQTIRIRYNNYNYDKGDVLFATLSAMYTSNKIVTNIVRLPNTIQETNYLNADGYYNIRGFYLWSKPFSEKKYVLSFKGSINYNNNISYIDNQKNVGQNWILSQGLNAQISKQPWLEINSGINYTYNVNTNAVLTPTNAQASTWLFQLDSKTYIAKTWLVGTDVNKTLNNGYKTANVDPLTISLYLEKQFFKGNTGALRLQVYDLLNQNTNITRSITGNTILDSHTNRLGRYFMLSFSMRLQKFSGTANTLMPDDSNEDVGKTPRRRRN